MTEVLELQVVEVVEIDDGGFEAQDTVEVVEIGLVGPPGADGADGEPGEQGEQGEPGPPGGGSEPYVHDQGTPASLWTVSHNRGYFPNVTIVDSSGRVIGGKVTYVSVNLLTIEFFANGAPVLVGGKAYLS